MAPKVEIHFSTALRKTFSWQFFRVHVFHTSKNLFLPKMMFYLPFVWVSIQDRLKSHWWVAGGGGEAENSLDEVPSRLKCCRSCTDKIPSPKCYRWYKHLLLPFMLHCLPEVKQVSERAITEKILDSKRCRSYFRYPFALQRWHRRRPCLRLTVRLRLRPTIRLQLRLTARLQLPLTSRFRLRRTARLRVRILVQQQCSGLSSRRCRLQQSVSFVYSRFLLPLMFEKQFLH